MEVDGSDSMFRVIFRFKITSRDMFPASFPQLNHPDPLDNPW